MTYIEELRKGRDKATVAYQEFVLHTRNNLESLFCFFEGTRGSDNSYYVPRIKQYFNNYQPIRCSGRKNVLKVHELIVAHNEYDKYKKAFFIDKDFNEETFIFNPPIFETPCYSVENLYVSHNVFSEILKNTLLIAETNPSYQVALDLYKNRQAEFHHATILFNAWYACLIEIRNAAGLETGVNLDDRMPKGFIDFSLKSISSNYDYNKIKDAFPHSLEVEPEILKKKIKEFESCEQHKIFRGKYEMYFLLRMIELMLQDSVNDRLFFLNKIKFIFGEKLSNDQAIAVFSGYAETPQSLINYLKKILEK